MFRAGSSVTVSIELTKYGLRLVGEQEIRWKGGGTEPKGEYIFFYGKGNENHGLGTDSLCIKQSYQQLKGLSLLLIRCHT
jgi:hypothetical protein